MVVLPDPIRQSAARHPLLRPLLVTDAGYFPQAAGHRVERPLGSSTHLMIACIRGRGWVRDGARQEHIAPGDVVWLAADRAHAYGADPGDPWTIVWAHFSGEELAAWRAELGWPTDEPIGLTHVTPDRVPDLGLDLVYGALEHGYSVPHLLEAAVALRSTFCTLLRLGRAAGAVRSTSERIARVRDQIAKNPARAYRLAELAATAGLSVPHFSALFRQQFGYAPIDFVIRERIRTACHLLDSTRARVAEIATEVGFADPYYFSRCFRRVMARSPLQYRKSVKA